MAVETAEERAAREAAEAAEEAAREARRQEIRNEISSLEGCRKGVETLIADLTTGKESLEGYIGEWSKEKMASYSLEIVSEVVIANVFEGVCADETKSKLSDCVAAMEQTCSDVKDLNGQVEGQIKNLRDYVTSINNEIDALNRELSSL